MVLYQVKLSGDSGPPPGLGEWSPRTPLRRQVELEEAVVRRRAAVQTLGQQAKVWSVRVLLNLLVVALLGAAFYGVYWATGATVELQVWRGPEPTFARVGGTQSVIPGILGGVGRLCGTAAFAGLGSTFSTVPPGPHNLFAPPSLPGDAHCPEHATAEARGGLPSVHLHLRGQLCAASRVQAHCPAGGLH